MACAVVTEREGGTLACKVVVKSFGGFGEVVNVSKGQAAVNRHNATLGDKGQDTGYHATNIVVHI